jgi:hypothetical protein
MSRRRTPKSRGIRDTASYEVLGVIKQAGICQLEDL